MLDSGTDWVGKGTEPPKSHVWAQGFVLKDGAGASLVAQWLRICLPVQGTWVWSRIREDFTCCRATKLVCHNYWARVPKTCALQQKKPLLWEACARQLEGSPCLLQLEKTHEERRPSATKNKYKFFFLNESWELSFVWWKISNNFERLLQRGKGRPQET